MFVEDVLNELMLTVMADAQAFDHGGTLKLHIVVNDKYLTL